MIAPARRAAYDALRAAATRPRDLGELLVESRERLHDDRDRALAAAIVVGTLRWRNQLDWLLARAANRDVASLDPEVLDVLRLSLFQLLHFSRVPASAVVDDAVSLTKQVRKKSAAGLTNAVLRKLSRSRNELDLPRLSQSPDQAPRDTLIEYLTIAGSHPRWLVERWIDRLGANTAASWVAFNNQEPPLALRVNTLRSTRGDVAERLKVAEVETVAARYAPDGLVVVSGQPLRTPEFDAGMFVVQDEASQIVPLLAGTHPVSRVLDACAAPGGKTLALAAGVARGGLLVASDVSTKRLSILREILQRAGNQDASCADRSRTRRAVRRRLRCRAAGCAVYGSRHAATRRRYPLAAIAGRYPASGRETAADDRGSCGRRGARGALDLRDVFERAGGEPARRGRVPYCASAVRTCACREAYRRGPAG